MSQSRLASNRANAQPLCWPAHRGRQETIVFERLPPRPHRPNRHPHPGRPSRLPKALRRHPRRSKSRRRPGNHPRPVHRRGLPAPQPSPGPRKLHLHPRPSRPLRPRRRQPRGRRRLRPRPHLDRTGPQPPAPYHLRTAHPPLHRKERSRASNAPNRAQSAVEQAEEKARLLVQLAEYQDRHGRNYDPSNDFPPESRPLGFVFSKSAVLGRIELGKRLKQAEELDWRGYLKSDDKESDDSSTPKQRPERRLTLPTIYVRAED